MFVSNCESASRALPLCKTYLELRSDAVTGGCACEGESGCECEVSADEDASRDDDAVA